MKETNDQSLNFQDKCDIYSSELLQKLFITIVTDICEKDLISEMKKESRQKKIGELLDFDA